MLVAPVARTSRGIEDVLRRNVTDHGATRARAGDDDGILVAKFVTGVRCRGGGLRRGRRSRILFRLCRGRLLSEHGRGRAQ